MGKCRDYTQFSVLCASCNYPEKISCCRKTDDEILALKKKVYDAINMYNNAGRYEELKKNYEKVHLEYFNSGGKYQLEYFLETIDDYNARGGCGY